MASKMFVRFGSFFAAIFAAFALILLGCAESVSIRSAPPILQTYDQPNCPGPGYIWEPGYWAYGNGGYHWVPGQWELAPEPGWMWTPGYWSCSDSEYFWHPGYWAKDVGFYGGIDYGHGYTGSGYEGGYWKDNDFYYNSAVTNANPSIVRNTYSQPPVNRDASATPASFNGGSGGVNARPTDRELMVANQPHIIATASQRRTASQAMVARRQAKQVSFKFKIDPGISRMNQTKVPNYQVVNDTAKFFFCSGGIAGNYQYKLKQNSDTLKVEENYGPDPLQKHRVLFCVFCTLSGLKTGQYFLKTTDGLHQIDIK
jgi:WXXGXW repeat (2 copies)